jgi:hypothetical protein
MPVGDGSGTKASCRLSCGLKDGDMGNKAYVSQSVESHSCQCYETTDIASKGSGDLSTFYLFSSGCIYDLAR